MKVGIYTRHKLEQFSIALKHELDGDYDAFVFSEDELHKGDIISSEEYYRYSGSFSELSGDDVEDVISRCRVLRSVKQDLALKLIERATRAIYGILFELEPDVVIAPRIDDYFLDILARVSEKEGVRFIGLWRSAFLNNMFFLTARGGFTKVRGVSRGEVDLLVGKMSREGFKATSIEGKKYSIDQAIKRYVKLYARAIIIEVVRRLSKNKFRYREMATRFFVNEYRIPFKKIFYSYMGWEEGLDRVLNSGNKKVFIALQVNPESTIDYYCDNLEFVNVLDITPKIIDCFVRYGYDVIIKDHPNMVGNRNTDFLRDLDDISEDVVVVPPSVDSTYLIKNCDVTYTWSGTVAVQAHMMRRKSICVCMPYYIEIRGLYKVTNLHELTELLKRGDLESSIGINKEDTEKLASHILSSHLQGDIFLHNKDMPGDTVTLANNLKLIIDSDADTEV